MAKRPTITTVASGFQSTTTLNTNFTNIRDAFDNTLSRDGSSPNQMNTDLDMNSNQILNLPLPVLSTEPIRKNEFDTLLADINSIIYGSETTNTASFATIAEASAATIPIWQTSVEVRGAVVDGIGGSRYYQVTNSGPVIGGQFQSNGGTRRWQIAQENAANILCHGAATDGVTDSTAAFTKAFQACNRAFVPPGTYRAEVVIPNGGILQGSGRDLSIIKALDKANTTPVAGAGAYSLFGTETYNLSVGCNNCTISDLTVDGNRDNVSTSGDGIAIWGYGIRIYNVSVKNCRTNGIRTEWTDGSVPMEGTFNDISIDTVGAHGFLFNGPHDSHFNHVVIVDASQNGDNGWQGMFIQNAAGGSANGRFFNLHVWHRSGRTNRCNYALYSSGANEFIGCHLEGCRQQVRAGSNDRFDNCLIYAPYGSNGTALMRLEGVHVLVNNCRFSPGAGDGQTNTLSNKNVYAINFVSSAGSLISNCWFPGFGTYTPFNFGTSTGSNVIADCYGYAAPGGTATFGGTIAASDVVDYVQGGTVINYRKPAAYVIAANDTAAASAGVPIGGYYELTATRALTRRAT